VRALLVRGIRAVIRAALPLEIRRSRKVLLRADMGYLEAEGKARVRTENATF
jgi:hypothetical protein